MRSELIFLFCVLVAMAIEDPRTQPEDAKAATAQVEVMATNNHLFKPRGTLVTGLQWGHIVLPFNFTAFAVAARSACLCTQDWHQQAINPRNPTTGSGRPVTDKSEEWSINFRYRSAETDCFDAQDIIVSLAQLFQFVEPSYKIPLPAQTKKTYQDFRGREDWFEDIGVDRERRQVAALGVMALAGVIGGAGALEFFESDSGDNVEELSAQANRLNLLQEEEAYLEKAVQGIGKLSMKIVETEHKLNLAWHCATYSRHSLDYAREVSTMLKRVYEQKVDLEMFRMAHLQTHLDDLRMRMEKQGFRSHVRDVRQLMRLPVSYHSDPATNMLRVFIHVPIFQGEEMDVYEYVPMAQLAQDQSGLLFRFVAESRYLATKSDLSSYKQLDSLSDCLKVEDVLHCAGHNIERKAAKKGCLMSLFSNLRGEVGSACQTMAIQNRDQVVQLDATRFFLYLEEAQQVTVSCHGKPDQRVARRGPLKVTLQPGCKATTEAFTFHAEEDVIGQEASILIPSTFDLNDHLRAKDKAVDMVKEALKDLEQVDIDAVQPALI